MEISFEGGFAVGGPGVFPLSGSVSTTRPHQPKCVAQFKDLPGGKLPVPGTNGVVSGTTPDRQLLELHDATLLTKRRREDGTHEAEFEFRSLCLTNDQVLGYLDVDDFGFGNVSAKATWTLSGEPRLNEWIRGLEECPVKRWIESRHDGCAVSLGLAHYAERSTWDADGLQRTLLREAPILSVKWPAGAVTGESLDDQVSKIQRTLEDCLLSLGVALDAPIVIWQQDVSVVGAGPQAKEKLARRRQNLGKAPMFRSASSENSVVDLTGVCSASRLDQLSRYRAHLEPAIQSHLWAPSLPPETEFITSCTALEALKEWYLHTTGHQSTVKSGSAKKRLEKAVRAVLRESDERGDLSIPLAVVLDKAPELTRPPLRWTLEQLASSLGIHAPDLSFIRARNLLVHTGSAGGHRPLSEHIASTRALTTAVLVAILDQAEEAS